MVKKKENESRGHSNGGFVGSADDMVLNSRKTEELEDDAEDKEDTVYLRSTSKDSGSTIVPGTQDKDCQGQSFKPEKIYWDDNNDIFGHASGMCYDPNNMFNAYYTLIDQDGGDVRPLYYI